jgi:hypothetical protein
MNQIRFDCPGCGQTIEAPEEVQFERTKCPTCQHEFSPDKTRLVRPAPAAPPPKPAAPAPTPPTVPASKPAFSLPPVEDTGAGSAFILFAVLVFIGAIIGAVYVGGGDDGKPGLGCLIFACGILSGLILIGFAIVIENTNESSQRLSRIEMLIAKAHDDKNAER